MNPVRAAIHEIVRRFGNSPCQRPGRHIHAISAPIAFEAVTWLLDDRNQRGGVRAAGELFDAEAYLAALSPKRLTVQLL